MAENRTVFIVDDDASVRDALSLLLSVHDYRVNVFPSAETFLAACRPDWEGCLLLDIRMPGMDGLSLQVQLQEAGSLLPVIMMTGHGDVASARQAFRAMAVDFLEKPLDHERLLAALEEAFRQVARTVRLPGGKLPHEVLTPREAEVMAHVVAGRHNREIAVDLGISPRTVEVHKARMMDKLGVDNIPDLVRLNMQGDPGAGR